MASNIVGSVETLLSSLTSEVDSITASQTHRHELHMEQASVFSFEYVTNNNSFTTPVAKFLRKLFVIKAQEKKSFAATTTLKKENF